MIFHFGLTCLHAAAVASSTLFVLPLKFYVKKVLPQKLSKIGKKKGFDTFFQNTSEPLIDSCIL